MVDLHAHILPGIDDGPGEWDKALKMLARAAHDGIVGIVATPHVVPGGYDNTAEAVLGLTEELKERTRDTEIAIYPGSELMVCNDTLRGLEKKKYLTINNSRYALVELPAQFSPEPVYDFIHSLAMRGLVPVIAHPERNPRIQEDMGFLHEMVGMGALSQITSGSLTGLFGNAVKRAAVDILGRRLCHVIASDAHNNGKRAPVLSHGLKVAAGIVGERDALAMVRETPNMILSDLDIITAEPLIPRKKRFLFF